MLCMCLFVVGIENVVLVVLCLRLITQLWYTLLSVVAQSGLADSKENKRVSEAHEVQDCERLHQHCRTLPGEAQLPVVT